MVACTTNTLLSTLKSILNLKLSYNYEEESYLHTACYHAYSV